MIDFELTYPRWWTLRLWNRTIAKFHQQHRLSYNALTRQYRLSFGNLHQNFDTLEEALGVLGRVRERVVFTRQDVDPDSVYIAALRLRLDTSQLPKPLQINALGLTRLEPVLGLVPLDVPAMTAARRPMRDRYTPYADRCCRAA